MLSDIDGGLEFEYINFVNDLDDPKLLLFLRHTLTYVLRVETQCRDGEMYHSSSMVNLGPDVIDIQVGSYYFGTAGNMLQYSFFILITACVIFLLINSRRWSSDRIIKEILEKDPMTLALEGKTQSDEDGFKQVSSESIENTDKTTSLNPASTLLGQTDENGVEWLDYPAGTETWWYRHSPETEWIEHK